MKSRILLLALGSAFVTTLAEQHRHAFLQPEGETLALRSTDKTASNPAVAVASAAVSARRAPIGPLGGPDADRVWPQESGLAFWVKSVLVVTYLSLIVAVAVIALFAEKERTWTTVLEAVALFVWLAGAVYLFCYHLDFQSPHFGVDKDGNGIIRRLNLTETIYLLSQIITTVGYGDITPATQTGQIIVAVIVLLSILLIASMVSSMVAHIQQRIDKAAAKSIHAEAAVIQDGQRWGDEDIPVKPLMASVVGFLMFVVMGCLFFHFYPGEGKTLFQGVYMSIITLSTVGFGAFTANTEGGRVFAAFWMLFGVGALGSMVASFTEFLAKSKAKESKKSFDMLKDLQDRMEKNNEQYCDFETYLAHVLVHKGLCTDRKIDAVKLQFAALDKKKKGKFELHDITSLKLSPRGGKKK